MDACTLAERLDRPRLMTLVVKTASYCNLRCSYCYIAPHNEQKGDRIIEDAIARKAVEDYARLARAGRGCGASYNLASFLWHGGEPLLAGAAFFEHVFEYQRQCFGEMNQVRNCLTTNGVLVDERWIELFKNHRVDLSVSIDGPPLLHDRHRRTRSGFGSSAAAVAGYLALRDAGLSPGVMMVVTDEAADQPEKVFEFFRRDLQVKHLAFVAFVTRTNCIGPGRYSKFVEKFFDLWLEADDPEFYVRDFNTIITRIFGGVTTLCEYNNCCGNYLALDSDGGVYSCDLFIGDPAHRLGSLTEDGLEHRTG